MAYNGISTALLEYLQAHKNRMVTINELVTAFDGTFERLQIMSNMGNLAKSSAGKGITRVQTGVWTYSETKEADSAAGEYFEILRQFEDGLILLSVDNKIYRAKEVK